MRDLKGSHPGLPRITMKSEDRNAAELLLDLKARTGVAMDLSDLLETENLADVAVDFADASFPEALERICKAANLGVNLDPDDIEFYTEDYEEAPSFAFRDCLFRLTEWSLKRVINFQDPPRDTLEATLEVLWDPRLQAAGALSSVVVAEAVDSKGKSLVPPKQPGENGDDPGLVSTGDSLDDIELLAPHPEAGAIALLRGHVTLLLPRTQVTLALEKVEEGAKAAKDAVQLCLQKIEPGRQGERKLQLELASAVIKADFLHTRRATAHLVVKGEGRVSAGIESMSASDGRLNLTVVQAGPRLVVLPPGVAARPEPPPIEKVEVVIVTETTEREIPFEFRNLQVK
jgi:hypothetical protein